MSDVATPADGTTGRGGPAAGTTGRGGLAAAGGAALGARIVAQTCQLLLFIAAARVLTPADLGVFTLALAVSTLFYVFAAAGWREFITSWTGADDDLGDAVDSAVTLSALSGYALATIGLATAAAFLFVQKPELASLSALLSVAVFLAPIGNTISGLLVKEGRIGSLSAATIVSEMLGLLVGLGCLLSGLGILALGIAKLAAQFVIVAGVMVAARRHFRLRLPASTRAGILEMSRQILANRLIVFASQNASTFLIGAFLGPAAVGLFRAGERVVSAISELILEPLRMLAWMVFSRAAGRARSPDEVQMELKREGTVFFPLVILIAAPAFIGLAVVSENIVTTMLGPSWIAAAPVVVVLSIAALISAPTIATEPLLSITGTIRKLTPVSTLNAVISIASLAVAAPLGLMPAAYARLFASLFNVASALYLQIRNAAAPWWGALKGAGPIYVGLIVLVSSVYAVRSGAVIDTGAWPIPAMLAMQVAIGAVVYLGVLLVAKPSYLRTTLWL